MWRVIHSLLLTAALAAPPACVHAQDSSTDDIRQLDDQIQGAKEDTLDIAAELNLLEQRLLYPTGTRLTVSLALPRAGRVHLRAAEIRIDDDIVANHIYSDAELKALQKGGVQNLYTGNVSIGRHELQLKIIGEHMDGAHFERKTSHVFTKDTAAKAIDITLDLAARENEVRISDR